MTQTNDTPPQEQTRDPKAAPKGLIARSIHGLIWILVLGVVAAFVVMRLPAYLPAPRANVQVSVQNKAPNGGSSQDQAGEKTSIVHNQIPSDFPVVDDAESDNGGAEPDAALEALAARVGSVETRLAALDSRLRAAEDKAEQKQTATQNLWAGAITFMPLALAAAQGHAFASELDTMRAAVSGDAALTGLLEQIAPWASTGVPTKADLRLQFEKLEPQAETQWRKAEAVTWWDRVRVAIESLVRVRIKGAGDDMQNSMAALEADLNAGHYADLAAAIDALPDAAKAVLIPLRDAASARGRLDDAMRAITGAFAARVRGGA